MKQTLLLGSIISLAIVTGFATQVDASRIHRAASSGDLDAIQQEINSGVDVNIQDEDGRTALICAKHDEVVQPLLAAGSDVDIQDNLGYTPLMHAVLYENDNIVQQLIDAYADVNIKNSWNITALMLAAWKGRNNKIVQQLMMPALM